jgi:hypothetical protein
MVEVMVENSAILIDNPETIEDTNPLLSNLRIRLFAWSDIIRFDFFVDRSEDIMEN